MIIVRRKENNYAVYIMFEKSNKILVFNKRTLKFRCPRQNTPFPLLFNSVDKLNLFYIPQGSILMKLHGPHIYKRLLQRKELLLKNVMYICIYHVYMCIHVPHIIHVSFDRKLSKAYVDSYDTGQCLGIGNT